MCLVAKVHKGKRGFLLSVTKEGRQEAVLQLRMHHSKGKISELFNKGNTSVAEIIKQQEVQSESYELGFPACTTAHIPMKHCTCMRYQAKNAMTASRDVGFPAYRVSRREKLLPGFVDRFSESCVEEQTYTLDMLFPVSERK